MSGEPAPISDEDVLAFVRETFASVWELELLLLLHRDPERRWPPAEIDRELRASETVVATALRRLSSQRMLVEHGRGEFQYGPANPRLRDKVAALEAVYRTNPVSVVKAILGQPDSKLKIFSEAFRFKE